jgi:hypothetical protein
MNQDAFDAETYLEAVAAAMELTIAPEWKANVLDNLMRSRQIAQAVLDFPLPDVVDPASVFKP